MRPRYPHRKLIKIDYETQFPTDPILNDKIKKLIYNLPSDVPSLLEAVYEFLMNG
jgi:hypothetical protein